MPRILQTRLPAYKKGTLGICIDLSINANCVRQLKAVELWDDFLNAKPKYSNLTDHTTREGRSALINM